MAKRRTEIAAASLLTSWTDADTTMQIVGTSLGVFGSGALDPTIVLATETPLRNALFDVLLSLVEGGALELRETGANRYAFRWRDDIALAGLSSDDETVIDLAAPSPYLAELRRVEAERDEALGRADFAEALAAERERQLRVAGARALTDPPEPDQPDSKHPKAKHTEPKPAETRPAELAEKPATRHDTHPAAAAKVAPGKAPATPKKPPAKKPPAKKPAAEKAARPKAAAATKPRKAAPTTEPTTEPSPPSEVVYLPAPVDVDVTKEPASTGPSRKWSGYAIDKARNHLTSVDRLADEG
jgi:hypothetical protein